MAMAESYASFRAEEERKANAIRKAEAKRAQAQRKAEAEAILKEKSKWQR
jgi:hypothetical protein